MLEGAPRALARLRRRAPGVLANAINSLLLPLLSPLVSLLVVRLASAELWGAFVQLLLLVQLGAHILGWGNREYLLRQFSQQPAQINECWQRALLARLPLLAGFLPALILLPPGRGLLVIGWALGLYLAQSCEVLVVYHKRFGGQMALEAAALAALLAAVLAWGAALTLAGLAALFGLAALGKAAILLLWLRPLSWQPAALRIDLGYFRRALPFFLLGLSGLLQSRIDQYYVNIFLTTQEIAHYQIVVSLLTYLQALANIVLVPFVKGMYRLRYRALLGLARKMLIGGLLLLGPALGGLALALGGLYGVRLPARTLLLGGLGVLPICYYLPVIYALYKAGRQGTVLKINLLGIALNLGLGGLLVARLRIDGGLIASAAAQWGMLFAYARQSRALRGYDGPALSELPHD